MHEEKFLGNTHNDTHCLVLVFILKVGIPTFGSEIRTRQVMFLGCFPGYFLHVYGLYMCSGVSVFPERKDQLDIYSYFGLNSTIYAQKYALWAIHVLIVHI